MKRLDGAQEVWRGQVAEVQHLHRAARRARPTAEGLTQQLNVLQICEPLCRCHPIGPAHDTTSRPPRYRAPTFAAAPIPLDNVPRLAQRQSIPE